mmetsp:Transcript_27656/g.74848  ORF Transcript_27656/g.74848 Transcript_27656/m.74848 type:complete len:226 (-) Transcript_27656:69-746(-)
MRSLNPGLRLRLLERLERLPSSRPSLLLPRLSLYASLSLPRSSLSLPEDLMSSSAFTSAFTGACAGGGFARSLAAATAAAASAAAADRSLSKRSFKSCSAFRLASISAFFSSSSTRGRPLSDGSSCALATMLHNSFMKRLVFFSKNGSRSTCIFLGSIGSLSSSRLNTMPISTSSSSPNNCVMRFAIHSFITAHPGFVRKYLMFTFLSSSLGNFMAAMAFFSLLM